LWSVPRMAPLLAGVAVGTASYLASIVALQQLATPFGGLLTTLWCAANALVCVYVAALLVVKRRA